MSGAFHRPYIAAVLIRTIEINENLLKLVKDALKKVMFIKLRDDLAEQQQQVFTDYTKKVEEKIIVDENGYKAFIKIHKCK